MNIDFMPSFEIKSSGESDDKFTFTGMATRFETIDSYGDLIKKGSFLNTIEKKHVQQKKNIKVFFNHTDVIGTVEEIKETDLGLFVKCSIAKTALGIEVRQLIEDGVIREMSIGFVAKKAKWIESKSQPDLYRIIEEIDLWEVSAVVWGAVPGTSIDSVKSQRLELRNLEINKSKKEELKEPEDLKKEEVDSIDFKSAIDSIDDVINHLKKEI